MLESCSNIKTIEYYPDKAFYSIQALEQKLQFKFVSQNSFETEEEKLLVQEKGLKKKCNDLIKPNELENGLKHRDKIEKAYIPSVSIRYVNDKVEHALFAEEDIPIGSYVGEYTGTVRPNDRLYTEPLNNYCYEYPVQDAIGRSYVIDASNGNLTRFINHSKNPNLKPQYAFFDGFYHLIFLSIKEIKKGTQLVYDYGNYYWYLRGKPHNI